VVLNISRLDDYTFGCMPKVPGVPTHHGSSKSAATGVMQNHEQIALGQKSSHHSHLELKVDAALTQQPLHTHRGEMLRERL
jgi:hypothetical protein